MFKALKYELSHLLLGAVSTRFFGRDIKRHLSSEIRIMGTLKTARTCQHDLTRHPIEVLKTSHFFSPLAFSCICLFLCFLWKLPWEGFGGCDHVHPLSFTTVFVFGRIENFHLYLYFKPGVSDLCFHAALANQYLCPPCHVCIWRAPQISAKTQQLYVV